MMTLNHDVISANVIDEKKEEKLALARQKVYDFYLIFNKFFLELT
jgi:hypothetical protein